ncbi:hypothetical protein [Streptomyces althioticus]|uniref:hypothetical protein n=1 Tax=Streptomyces althioticus TaxID=83380 RepID=UPI00331D0087
MGIFRRRENAADDRERTCRLLDGLDAAYDGQTGPITDFERVIISATGAEQKGEYPPPGHDYPRR